MFFKIPEMNIVSEEQRNATCADHTGLEEMLHPKLRIMVNSLPLVLNYGMNSFQERHKYQSSMGFDSLVYGDI